MVWQYILPVGIAAAGALGYDIYGDAQRRNLEGGNGSPENHIRVRALSDWYKNHQLEAAQNGALKTLEERPFSWADNYKYTDTGSANPNYSWFTGSNGQEDLTNAFAFAEDLRKQKDLRNGVVHNWANPIRPSDAQKAYQLYANDGWFERGDSGNLWDIYANNELYSKKHPVVQGAHWIADYLDDLNYLNNISKEDPKQWSNALSLYLNMANKADASGYERESFREMLKRVHDARINDKDLKRFYMSDDPSSNENGDSVKKDSLNLMLY